jgi:uncharacterized protein YndB with AHSA1/START domain
MGDYHILMQFDIDSERDRVREALTRQEAIRSWWSTRSELSGGDNPQLRVSFPDLPQPFEFTVRDGGPDRVDWVTGSFPPWWAGTTVRWDLGDRDDGKPGTRLQFSHRDYDADNPVIPIVTPAWAQIIVRLKQYAETGTPQPYFDF